MSCGRASLLTRDDLEAPVRRRYWSVETGVSHPEQGWGRDLADNRYHTCYTLPTVGRQPGR